jgi:hypothetical protein
MNDKKRVSEYLAQQVGTYKPESGNPDFFTPEGFFMLVNWMEKKNILRNWLSVQVEGQSDPFIVSGLYDVSWLDPETFPERVAVYLGLARG